MNSLKYVVTVLSVCALSLSGCGSTSSGSSTDTNTNWLKRCTKDPDCPSSLSCLCGVCTESCENKSSCVAFSTAAVCRTEERACGAGPVALCALRDTELGDSSSAPNDGGPIAEEQSEGGSDDISGSADAGSNRIDGGSGVADSGAGNSDASVGGPDASSSGVDAGMGSGGASSGGASSGGASSGGASTGGANSGGASTGGASSGGASTGGASTGGASSGGSGGAQECAAPEGQDYPAETFEIPNGCGESFDAFGDRLVVSEEEFQLAYPCAVDIQSGIDFNVQQLYLAFVSERIEATLNYVHIDDAGDVTVGIDSPVYCGGAAPPDTVVPVLMNKTLRAPSTVICSSGKCVGPPPP